MQGGRDKMTKTIKLIDYALKSIPGMSVKLPEEAVAQADGLMKVIVESKDTIDLFEKVKENPLLNKIYSSGIEEGILTKSKYLRKSKVDSVRSLTFKDIIYLGISSDYLTRDKKELLNTLPLREPIAMVERMVYSNLQNPVKARKRLEKSKERLKLGNKKASGFDDSEFWGFM